MGGGGLWQREGGHAFLMFFFARVAEHVCGMTFVMFELSMKTLADEVLCVLMVVKIWRIFVGVSKGGSTFGKIHISTSKKNNYNYN